MDNLNENTIEWERGKKQIAVTLCGNTKLTNKILKLGEQYPDEVKILSVNKDGSIFAHIPLKYLKISRPRDIGEKERERLREQAKRNNWFTNRFGDLEAIDEEFDLEEEE